MINIAIGTIKIKQLNKGCWQRIKRKQHPIIISSAIGHTIELAICRFYQSAGGVFTIYLVKIQDLFIGCVIRIKGEKNTIPLSASLFGGAIELPILSFY